MNPSEKRIIESGIIAADSRMLEEDKIWSRYSNDKVDIGEELTGVIRTLVKELPLSRVMRALSIGSSDEPQFRILETAFRGGLYLLDVDREALSIVQERIHRQTTDHVVTIRRDYKKIFLRTGNTKTFLEKKLGGRKVDLITLHHSLYYCRQSNWGTMFDNLYRRILAPKGAIHAVLMAADSNDQYTTTWLYNYFAGKFCGSRKDQDLYKLRRELETRAIFKDAQMLIKTHRIRFYVNDFAKFMAVIWMILLYPDVCKYTLRQKEEITEFIYRKFWLRKKPLIQEQDHLVIYRGISRKGLI